MGLSSQSRRDVIGIRSTRSTRGWSRRQRKRQRLARRVMTLAVLAAVLVGGWWLVLRPDHAAPAADPALAVNEPDRAPDTVDLDEALPEADGGATAPSDTIAATPERRPAAVLRMGEPVDGLTGSGSGLREQIRRAAVSPESETPDESPDATGVPVFASTGAVRDTILAGYDALEHNRPVDARRLLSVALLDPACAPGDRAPLRTALSAISERLLFSPTIAGDDPLVTKYVVEPGDALSRIARKTGAAVDWRFIQRVNRISDPRRIRVGQTLKIVKGPFHAVVDKSDYRLDLFAQVPSAEGGGLVYVRSFPVGLGELGSTPTGSWVVRDGSKLVNPDWTNPRTGERFDKENPLNPIGERWIGLRGTDPETEALAGYGIHGTIEPGSIGKQRSMGCVRLLDDDVAMVYELLTEGNSRVTIVE